MCNSDDLFDKKYVHVAWDDVLDGKRVFVGDTLGQLLSRFCTDSGTFVCKAYNINADEFPFKTVNQLEEAMTWRFAYYDPYLELRVAEHQGKVIQVLTGCEWRDLNHGAIFHRLPEMYRIKPEGNTLVTNRQLARWLAKGNGEFCIKGLELCCVERVYNADEADTAVDSNVVVRTWDDDTWYAPTKEYLGIEE